MSKLDEYMEIVGELATAKIIKGTLFKKKKDGNSKEANDISSAAHAKAHRMHELKDVAKWHGLKPPRFTDLDSDLKAYGISRKELDMGIKVEFEHTRDREAAILISLHHLSEPGQFNYYSKLKKIEGKKKADELSRISK